MFSVFLRVIQNYAYVFSTRVIMPWVQLLFINMHWVRTVWGSFLHILISPLSASIGKCYSGITIRLKKDEENQTQTRVL